MSTLVARRRSWPVYAVTGAPLLAAVGMITTAALHTQLGKSVWLDAVAVVTFAAAFVGALGALILANTRRNVMWILGVAISTTVLLALAAIVLSTLAPDNR
jgi:hypothetical protein